MLGLSFSELMLIGVVALIVIGPEKLPKVARTVGHLLGRAQRYVNEVKTDIRKEMDGTEIGNLKDQMQEAANSVKASVDEASKSWRAPIDEAQDALRQASDSVKTLADSARKLDSDAAPSDPAGADEATEHPAADTAGNADSSAVPPSLQPNAIPEQDIQPAESGAQADQADVVDTRTLPLPGFDQKQAPAGTPVNLPPADKGSQP